MTFLFPFFNFLQPGILWPELADFRPMLVVLLIALVLGLMKKNIAIRLATFKHPIFLLLIVFIAAQVLSVYETGATGMLNEFSYWSAFPLFVLVSVLLISQPIYLRRYVLGVVAGSMGIVFYGIYAVIAELPAAVGGRAGAYGMYENHNDYSFIIIQTLPFIYMFWRGERGILCRNFYLICMIACAAGIFLSLSRGGVLALVLEAGLLVAFTVQGRKRYFLLPSLVLAGALAIGYQWSMREENQGSNYTAEDAQSSRFELWRAGKKMFLDKPLFGVGSRRFGEFSQEYEEISHDNLGKNSHNTFIEILATSGIVGLGAFLLMVYHAIRQLRRSALALANGWVDEIRLATFISFVSILFRAFLDAKAHDWSFYVLVSITLGYINCRNVDLPQNLSNEIIVPDPSVVRH